jgi:hypothetical protein
MDWFPWVAVGGEAVAVHGIQHCAGDGTVGAHHLYRCLVAVVGTLLRGGPVGQCINAALGERAAGNMYVGFDIAHPGLPGDGNQVRQGHREAAHRTIAEIDVAQRVRCSRREHIALAHQALGSDVLAGWH